MLPATLNHLPNLTGVERNSLAYLISSPEKHGHETTLLFLPMFIQFPHVLFVHVCHFEVVYGIIVDYNEYIHCWCSAVIARFLLDDLHRFRALIHQYSIFYIDTHDIWFLL